MEIQRDYYLEQLKIRRESLNKILISFAIVVLVFILVSCGNRKDEADFNNAMAEFKAKRLYDTGVEPQYGDKLITLSTCTYHVEDGRFVLVLREKTA